MGWIDAGELSPRNPAAGRIAGKPGRRCGSWKSAKLQPVKLGRRSRKQRGLFRFAILRRDALEGVEDHLIAALAFVRWEIALEHGALRAERLDAGFDSGAPR